jgi:tRNA pseudouridine-54 N-methylase
MRNLEVIALLADDTCLTFNNVGAGQNTGEKQWATLIQKALRGEDVEGISFSETTLESLIVQYKDQPDSEVIVLEEDGSRFDSVIERPMASQYSFMLGNHQGFDSKDKELFEKHNLSVTSLGYRSYLGSHCIAAMISHFEGLTDASR